MLSPIESKLSRILVEPQSAVNGVSKLYERKLRFTGMLQPDSGNRLNQQVMDGSLVCPVFCTKSTISIFFLSNGSSNQVKAIARELSELGAKDVTVKVRHA